MNRFCSPNANLIAKPSEIQGFIVGESTDPYYTVQRLFIENSTLKKYLQRKRPEKVKEESNSCTLYEILQHIKEIVDEEHLYDERNPCIIICDKDLDEALNVRSLLTSDTHEIIRHQIPPTEEANTLLKGTDKPTSIPRSAHPDTLYVPSWASEESTAIKAAKASWTSFEIGQRWKTKPKLTEFLKRHDERIKNDIIFDFEDILLTVMDYTVTEAQTTYDQRHEKIVHLTGTELEDVLEVNAADFTQIVSLLQYNLVHPEPIEERVQALKENFPNYFRHLNNLFED